MRRRHQSGRAFFRIGCPRSSGSTVGRMQWCLELMGTMDLATEELLRRLLALNLERAAQTGAATDTGELVRASGAGSVRGA